MIELACHNLGGGGLLAITESGGGVCLVCSKQFSTLSYCKVHFRTKHQHDPDDGQQVTYNQDYVQQNISSPRKGTSNTFQTNMQSAYITGSTSSVKQEWAQQFHSQSNAGINVFQQQNFDNQVSSAGVSNIKGELSSNVLTSSTENEQTMGNIGFIQHNTNVSFDTEKMFPGNLKRSFPNSFVNTVEGNPSPTKNQKI